MVCVPTLSEMLSSAFSIGGGVFKRWETSKKRAAQGCWVVNHLELGDKTVKACVSFGHLFYHVDVGRWAISSGVRERERRVI